MKTRIIVAAAFCTALVSLAGETYSLNTDWRFVKASKTIPLSAAKASVENGGVKVEDPAFDDSQWEMVSVPHPINAHDSFDERAVDAGEASFWRGVAFYRKRFVFPGNGERIPRAKRVAEGDALAGVGTGKVFLTFETVRQAIYVWVNGRFAGYYEAGIAPTAFDVTDLVKSGENVVCVAIDNCAARGTKIFTHETIPGHEPGDMSGATYQWNTTDFNEVQGGIVGNVSLVVKPSKTYLTLPYYNNLKTVGTYVAAKDFDFEKGAATICVKAEVRNESGMVLKAKVEVSVVEAGILAAKNAEDAKNGETLRSLRSLRQEILPAADAGKVYLSSLESDVYEPSPAPTRVASPGTAFIEAESRVAGLKFWSPDTPHLYDVVVSLVDEKGNVLDSETIRTGFREVKYDAAKGGLLVNGKNLWLTGYAQRSTDEWAAIGVAPDWLQDYDAALIRKSNANFVRWMHVAPKPAPVRSFDKFGVVCAAPAGDKEGDVSGRAWAQRVEAMRDTIIYFRNSPSIFFWEAGNNQISPAHMKEMVELKKLLDPDGGRFMGSRTLQTKEQVAEAEYVGTMLHRHEMPAFHSMEALGKFIPIMETEYARQESPRRSWDDFTPPDYDYRGKWLNGGKKETGFDVYDQTQEDFALSTAKEYSEFYGARSFGNGAKTYAACAALCWSDSNQHGRQSFSENCRSSGRVDAVRIPKMNFDVFRVMQSEDPAVTLVGHWSYPKLSADTYRYPVKKFNGHFMEETGEMAQRNPLKKTVYAIGSVHCASVELLVNGKSKSVVSKPKDVFVYEFKDIDVTESGKAEVVARDKAGKEIARHSVSTFEGPGKIVAKVKTGPKGWLADGSDIAVVDFALVDDNGTIHPYASDKISFKLGFEIEKHASTLNSPTFMGGWNSGVFGEASPVGKDFVNLECGVARVFVKAGRKPGKVALEWSSSAKATEDRRGVVVELLLKPVAEKGGMLAERQQEFEPNGRTFGRKTDAPAVQDLCGAARAADKYSVFVNGVKVSFHNGLGAPVKPDDNTGVCCAYVPVLEALKAAGAALEFVHEPKRIPANKKWLRKLSPTPFVPMVTVKAGGHEIDACVGFTELFIDNGNDKNLTNCEIYRAREKSPVVCGELVSLIGYIPGVELKTDTKRKVVELSLRGGAWPLQARIDAIAESGGGTLVLAPGVYKTGALFFKPGVNLRLEKGAEIVGVDDEAGYPFCETRIEGETCRYYPAIINADRCDGFTISGEGVIDGHGANTWEDFWTKRSAAKKKGQEFRNKDLMRPRVLYVSRSKNVDVSGVTFKNSKFWTTHFYDCEDVTVHDCTIRAEILRDSKGGELKGPSTDAIDIDKCRRFTVRNVDISVNDDGVVVKGGKGPWADDYNKFPGNGPSSGILVENCVFRYPTHTALTLGSECPAASGVTMRNCTMDGCGNLLNLKMRSDTPQRYSDVLVEGCKGSCRTFLRVQNWRQYHNADGRPASELKSFAKNVVLRRNELAVSKAKDIDKSDGAFEIEGLVLDDNVLNGSPAQ